MVSRSSRPGQPVWQDGRNDPCKGCSHGSQSLAFLTKQCERKRISVDKSQKRAGRSWHSTRAGHSRLPKLDDPILKLLSFP